MTLMNNPYIKSDTKLRSFFICLFLALSTLFVYLQVVNFDFISLDDNLYVYNNQYIQNGLTAENIAWSFSFSEKSRTYWHPLTWLSHSLDCQLFGLNAGMHHLTSLIIHILNSILLFLVFSRMTGDVWKSAFVAVLFALHPINVDSVAWIAERKNVLSTFFWMLTMLTYALYCEKPRLHKYLLTCLVFALGLLAKPMLVTLPCVLLLMDYWPLGRIRSISIASISHKIMEKIPLFFLSGISIYLSTLSQKNFDAIILFEHRSLALRAANALVSYARYTEKIIWPQNLAVHYPYPVALPLWKPACAGVLLVLVLLIVFFKLKQRPYLSVGLLWFIGTLVPVSGLMQVGFWPAIADRWAYVPAIGLFIIISWGMPDLLEKWRQKTRFLIVFSLTAILALIPITWMQVQHWSSSIALYEHALHVTDDNPFMHSHLGSQLAKLGKTEEAIKHNKEAVKIDPEYLPAHNYLGNVLAKQGKIDEAIWHYLEALKINPVTGKTQINLGALFLSQGNLEKAFEHTKKGLIIYPESPEAHVNMGIILTQQGRPDEAIRHYNMALKINPGDGIAHRKLEELLSWQDK